jgi:3-dehydroquinate synthetase
VHRHLAAVGLPVGLAGFRRDDWTAERLMTHMGRDKKVAGGKLAFILARGIGHAFICRDVSPTDMGAFLEERLGAPR